MRIIRKIPLLALLAILGLVLAACNIGNSNETVLPAEPATSAVQPPAQVVAQTPAITLTTSANPATFDQVGRQIVFTYVIKNSGSSNLGPTQFTVTDTLIGAAPFNCGDPNVSLVPNGTVSCTATYNVTQADMGAVSITSIAIASGGGAATPQPASATVNKGPVVQSNPANLTPGSTISHTVADGEWIWQIARCYGVSPNAIIAANRQLANPAQISPKMVITVPNIGSAGTIYGPPCVVKHPVKSGDTWDSIAQLYNADVSILKLVNKNTLTVGSEINVPRNSAGGTAAVSKALSLTTTPNPLTYDQVGQQITFTYVIRNSGNTNLGPDQFRVSDTLISPTPFNCGNAGTTLVPNATVTCTAAYTITQTDVNAVSVTNIATASGGGAGPSQSASSTVNKAVKAMTLTTTANPTAYDQAGQQITLTYAIKNTGGSALGPTQFLVSDTLVSLTPFNCGNPNITLAPNETVTCTAAYTITQADANAVSVTSVATASGGGIGPVQAAPVTINKAVRGIALTTTANPPTYNQVGQQITFTYVIKNSGNVTLGPGQFTVSDSLIGSTPINCGDANTTLAATATVTCSAAYTIKQADLSAVSVTNLAIASGPGVGPSQPASSTVLKQ